MRISIFVLGLFTVMVFSNVLVSINPLRLMAEEILGERVEVLIDPNVNPHTFQLKPSDLVRIKRSEVLIALGYGFEEWLKRVSSGDVCIVTKGLEKTMIDNPHVWLDPVLSIYISRRMADCLEKVYPSRKEEIEKNLSRFQRKMVELSERFSRDLSNLDGTILELRPALYHSAMRFFGGDYVSVVGPSQPSLTPRRLKEIVSLCKREKMRYIIVEKNSNVDLARPVIRSCKLETTVVDVLGSDSESFEEMLLKIESAILEAVR